MKLLRFLLIVVGFLLGSQWSWAQSQHQSGTLPKAEVPKPAKASSERSFGSVMLRLGKGLLKEVSRRLNLEEAEIVTVKKEVMPDGSLKYHVDTGKFQFDVKKKPKPPK